MTQIKYFYFSQAHLHQSFINLYETRKHKTGKYKKLKQTEWINEEIKLLWKILIINARLNKITITNYGVIKLSV